MEIAAVIASISEKNNIFQDADHFAGYAVNAKNNV